ncbi:MAG: 2-oxoglutarate dehydrogenase E1 component [Anaerolineae bacterium]|jgi:2-oxoglutarate dehydrogenase E1 component|nr:2-oxoglutarate dehydrogenase E1 component [Anaerolineae bacterium]
MTPFYGANEGYVLDLYERFRENPQSLDPQTRAFFASWSPEALTGGLDAVANGQVSAADAADTQRLMQRAVGAVNFAQAIRQFGHVQANIDPLGAERPGDPELDPAFHGITWDDLRGLPASLVGGPIAAHAIDAHEAVQQLQAVYCGSIGFDNDHIRIPEERNWLREAAESRRYRYEWSSGDTSVKLLDRLAQVEAFEQFLQNTFPTKYRFSVEGLDTMIPMLDEIIRLSGSTGMNTIAIAMAHRGRLNVLAHIMGKPYAQILSEFRDTLLQDDVGYTHGDVKYHKGVRYQVGKNTHNQPLIVTMPPNPSHLEAANPVAVGMARAAGTQTDHPGPAKFDPSQTMQVLIHGDAAFPGQGIVAETFNMSQVPGYWTGGTIHIIANNQVGFTTLPADGRSTLYASDLAKGFKAPIFHVNADDPAAVIEVARIAFGYQNEFEKDIVIDLVGYRRHGHNEMDEPMYTQPVMYKGVRAHPSVRHLWADQLVQRGGLSAEQAQALYDKHTTTLQSIYDTLPPSNEFIEKQPEPPRGAASSVITAVDFEALADLNQSLGGIPDEFNFTSVRFKNTLADRRRAFDEPDEARVDWATAEELAFASILAEGTPIRLTGQDCERGTFSHRHAVLRDVKNGEKFVPLHNIPQVKATFEVYNSPLSEEAVLGFEYGYSVQEPGRLVIWEAQYGDFANTAQVIIDQFIMSGRDKWGQTPSLVMLLPHGSEGAGPDHTSARLERYLQQAANTNVRICYPTTAAQYFHLLRRQALLLKVDPLPLIVMSPKSLLRKDSVKSTVRELATGRWRPVISDADVDPMEVTRLVLTTGKLYYDLVESEYRASNPHVAVARVEQLYPFPKVDLMAVVNAYPNLKQLVWAQEEPRNMGAWDYIGWRLRKLVGPDLKIFPIGRRRSASAAEGSKNAFFANQQWVVKDTFTWNPQD